MIGLSKTFYNEKGQYSGPHLLNKMFQKRAIDDRIFSVHFNVDHDVSELSFGSFDISKVQPNVPLTYLDVPYKEFWSLNVNAYRLGDKPLLEDGSKSGYYFKDTVAILDTFSPFVKLPKSIAPQLIEKFFGPETEIEDRNASILMGSCDLAKYKPINFFVNDRFYMKLTPESFVVNINQKKCLIAFIKSADDDLHLGEPFFKNFLTIFDDGKGMVGFGPSINFKGTSIAEGIVPNDPLLSSDGKTPLPDNKPVLPTHLEHDPEQTVPASEGLMGYLNNAVNRFVFWVQGKRIQEADIRDYTSVIKYGGIAILVGAVLGCIGIIVGGVYMFNYFNTMGKSKPENQADLPGGNTTTTDKPKVRGSRRYGGYGDEEGVSMSNLLHTSSSTSDAEYSYPPRS